MWQYTQEISIVVFALLCVAVLALLALVISRAVKYKKIPVMIFILLAVLAAALGCVIFATLAAGNPHPIAPPA